MRGARGSWSCARIAVGSMARKDTGGADGQVKESDGRYGMW
jgi:hypothetical protein